MSMQRKLPVSAAPVEKKFETIQKVIFQIQRTRSLSMINMIIYRRAFAGWSDKMQDLKYYWKNPQKTLHFALPSDANHYKVA